MFVDSSAVDGDDKVMADLHDVGNSIWEAPHTMRSIKMQFCDPPTPMKYDEIKRRIEYPPGMISKYLMRGK